MENKFVDGLFVNRRDNSPDFLMSSLSFNQKFIDFLQANFNAKGYVNIDVLKSKEGKLYAKLNDWQPKAQDTFIKTPEGKIEVDSYQEDIEEINPSLIPF